MYDGRTDGRADGWADGSMYLCRGYFPSCCFMRVRCEVMIVKALVKMLGRVLDGPAGASLTSLSMPE